MDSLRDCDLDTAVPDWLIEHPGLLGLFETLSLEYSCGGKSLGTACREAGLEPREVMELIRTEVEGRRNCCD